MIECTHLEWIDNTAWHGDVFDHPSYKSICILTKKDVNSYFCYKCPLYTPDYERLSDSDLRYELKIVKQLLESDDRMQPMSAYVASELTNRRNQLMQEARHRRLTL